LFVIVGLANQKKLRRKKNKRKKTMKRTAAVMDDEEREKRIKREVRDEEERQQPPVLRGGLTGIAPVELERINPTYLYTPNDCQPKGEARRWDDKNREQCKLYQLLTATTAIDQYVGLCFECLAADHVYPFTAGTYEHVDEILSVRTCNFIRAADAGTDAVVYQRALLLIGLRMSSTFRNLFCPPPDSQTQGRFLVNPEKLRAFVKGPDAPLPALTDALFNGKLSVPVFAAMGLMKWTEMMPWEGREHWGATDPNTPSVDVRLITRDPGSSSTGRLLLTNGGPAPPPSSTSRTQIGYK
jgi:hypothetical protein